MRRLLVACVILASSISCRHEGEPSRVQVIHVLRNPVASFAPQLSRANRQFALTKPRLSSGITVLVATNEGDSFAHLMSRIADDPDSLLILDSESELPQESSLRALLGPPTPVCGRGGSAYIPLRISGDEREATEMYLRFLKDHCAAP